mmetsp:Transcript_1665/g.2638  ORF Transcript_1665/g.2638 Transcript_1665/m.2638 type:complete len:406 (-) Transcript_1665:101-1318(-)|eukprot:CAMPEP_0185029008 /NCGR_PEP_ID=MMETSP1103-20130426/15096_1 /TAXON_ID=36769 /ORGANISM="Paraphysomonas bandaiensis, Strain Caron Lab Isolate" /LENGTH=405 /DNA_ID=CAMNT_0027563609 /DNA_START=44 /DNA_END=1261 /DNA_ORIENTATION=+
MGSGVSVEKFSALPEFISREEFGPLFHEKYRMAIYNALKEENDMIDRAKLLSIVFNDSEMETFGLFLRFCATGEMDENSFIRFFREGKLLSKKKLPKQRALAIFRSKADKKCLNYNKLRFELLPLVSEEIGMETSMVIVRLSNRLVTSGLSECLTESAIDDSEPAGRKHSNFVEIVSDIQKAYKAVLKIQSLFRAKHSRNKTIKKKELKMIEDAVGLTIDVDLDTATFEGPHEEKLQKVFTEYGAKLSTTGPSMNKYEFCEVCQDSLLFQRHIAKIKPFVFNDGLHMFDKVLTTVLYANDGKFSKYVVNGKRVRYCVFRALLVPALAERLGNVSVESIIKDITSHIVLEGQLHQDDLLIEFGRIRTSTVKVIEEPSSSKRRASKRAQEAVINTPLMGDVALIALE